LIADVCNERWLRLICAIAQMHGNPSDELLTFRRFQGEAARFQPV
jgi:hypothetical protein